jgi:hypothetical protein
VVLAEGIETEDDLATAQALGARWGQGWLFGRPGPLSALAGWPVHPYARLRPPRPDLHMPPGTPFSLAAVRHYSRAGDQRMVEALTRHLLSLAASSGPHTVVLSAYPDGAVGPALPGADRHPVRLAAAPADWTETVLAVVSPQATAALCVRPGSGDGVDFVLTHDPDLVHAVARILLGRVGGSVAEAPVAAAGQPIA